MAKSSKTDSRRIVVALGGNAITRHGEAGTVEQDYTNLRESLDSVVKLVQIGHEVVLTHGNGPQVGNQMIRAELARDQVPDLPLDLIVADLQGGLGYMIERVLRNRLLKAGVEVPLCALLTQIEVASDDPALTNPTKFVGPSYSQEEIERLAAERGWDVKEDKGRGWRRVVPSPEPLSIVEGDLIRLLVDNGALVIVTGGGGIPVTRDAEGLLHGVEGVIDKDSASVQLASAVDASHLFILTSVETVFLDFGTPEERPVRYMTVSEARRHLADGQFPPGTMGPKIEAACRFIENGGERVLITDIFTLMEAIDGSAGTWITP